MKTGGIYEFLEIGEMMRHYRKNAKLSQIQVSKLIGVSNSCYSNYENGNREPNIRMMLKICDTLNVPIGEFFSQAVKQIENKGAVNVAY